DRVPDLSRLQVVADLGGDLDPDAGLRLFRRRAEVRRGNDARVLQERAARRRLGLEHVEGRARDLSAVERLEQRGFVDEPAARRVDDADAALRPREVLARDETARLR